MPHKDATDSIVRCYQLYKQKMYHIAFSILNDPFQAEDAVMDALEKLLKQGKGIPDPDAASAKHLIIKVTRSAAIDIYRKNRRRAENEYLAADEPMAAETVDESADPALINDEMPSVLLHLPPKYQEILYLKYVRESSTQEIAQATGLSEAAVRKRLQRGLEMIRGGRFTGIE